MLKAIITIFSFSTLIYNTVYAETHVINCQSMAFVPNIVEVVPGDVIRWQYVSGFPHTATSGPPCSYTNIFHGSVATFNPIFEWEVPLDIPDEIPFYCIPHCQEGMTGIIYIDNSATCVDITGDDIVNVSDLLFVIDEWGQQKSPADITGDGVVTISDLLSVISNWGPCE